MRVSIWRNPDGTTQKLRKHVFGKDCTGTPVKEGDTLFLFPDKKYRVFVDNFRFNGSSAHPCHWCNVYFINSDKIPTRHRRNKEFLEYHFEYRSDLERLEESLMVAENVPMTFFRWLKAKKHQLIYYNLRYSCASVANKIYFYISENSAQKQRFGSMSYRFFLFLAEIFGSLSAKILLGKRVSFWKMIFSHDENFNL